MGALKFAAGANYKRFYQNLKQIGKKEGRSAPLMFCDAALSVAAFGSGLTDYLNYEFYKKPWKERREYVTIRVQDDFYEKVSPSAYKKVFTVKPNFFRAFAKYTGRTCFDPETGDAAGLERFLAENSVFMEKPVDGLGGSGVRRREAAEVPDAAAYYRELAEERKFIEQYIVQHPEMARLCPRSVNTIRVMTSSTSGTPKLIFACLRVGNGSCDVDNFHGGGMTAQVDADTGSLMGDAFDKALNRYAVHPLSGVPFQGFTVPFWPEVKAMVCEAALVEPRIMVIGWDVAITPEGPVFVEGNRRPGFDVVQVASGRGRMDLVRTALAELAARNGGQAK